MDNKTHHASMEQESPKNTAEKAAPPRSPGYVLLRNWDDDWGDRPLHILYVNQSPETREELDEDVHILSRFANAWDKGQKDLNRREPPEDVQPAFVFIVLDRHYQSPDAPTEPTHMALLIASKATWEARNKYARGCFHIHTGVPANGRAYWGWKAHEDEKHELTSDAIKADLRAAKSVDLYKALSRYAEPEIDAEQWKWVQREFVSEVQTAELEEEIADLREETAGWEEETADLEEVFMHPTNGNWLCRERP